MIAASGDLTMWDFLLALIVVAVLLGVAVGRQP